MPSPLLSVIIPTASRPQHLPKAIASALDSAPNGDVEVIIIPNGPDESWKTVAREFKTDSRAQWHPITTPHANVARNHGLAVAKGKLVRFLDDDDYFYPREAADQCRELLDAGADHSAADINAVDEAGNTVRTYHQPETNDVVAATLAPQISTLPTAHIFRRDLIKDLSWDITINKGQDVHWMMEICGMRELNTVRSTHTVGAWVQHRGARVSEGHHPDPIARQTVMMITALIDKLSSQGRLTPERAAAAADGLWACVHHGLMFSPRYWMGVARLARALAPGRHPHTRMYEYRLLRRLDPLIPELAIVPWRWMRRSAGKDYKI